jgi:hypothetical protein
MQPNHKIATNSGENRFHGNPFAFAQAQGETKIELDSIPIQNTSTLLPRARRGDLPLALGERRKGFQAPLA